MDASQRQGDPGDPPGRAGSTRFFALVLGSFLALSFVLYRPALDGPFISDDRVFVLDNPYVKPPAAGRIGELLDPTGTPREYVGGNYAPVVHLAHALEWRLWGRDPRGYHLVNVAVHALNAALLSVLLLTGGVSRAAAAVAGAAFLLHPANVEAVAWISQLKTVLALALALGALLLWQRYPLASIPVFALALLSKATAAFALPMAAGLYLASRGRGTALPRQGLALALWAAVFAVYAPVQMAVFSTLAESAVDRIPDLATHVRFIAAIGARYLAMAAIGYGTSALHEPDPVRSDLGPWWLAGVALALGFTWRIAVTLRARRAEAGWWLGAAAGFAPVSQVFPFFFGMADRYLYFILPGLIGGTILAARAARERLEARLDASRARVATRGLRWAAAGAAALLLAGFALHAHGRAGLWRDERRLYLDAASQYPDGSTAHFTAAVLALESGDRDRALAHLAACMQRGGHLVHTIVGNPRLARLRDDPRFRALQREMMRDRIETVQRRGGGDDPSIRAGAHALAGRLDEAIAVLERAMQEEGPRPDLLSLHQQLRAERARQRHSAGGREPPAGGDAPSGEPLRPLPDLPSQGAGLDTWLEPLEPGSATTPEGPSSPDAPQ